MSGIDEQRPICHACGKSSYFTFRLRLDGVLHNIWLIDEKHMKKFKYKKPVIFGKFIPKRRWREVLDNITDVRCHDCAKEEDSGPYLKKLIVLLKHIFDKEGGLSVEAVG